MDNNFLVFFNQSQLIPIEYTYAYHQPINNIDPHGLWRVNDSFFYATSYATNSIYSYAVIHINTTWIETLVIHATNVISMDSGTHVMIDECGRFWFSMEEAGVQVFDRRGN